MNDFTYVNHTHVTFGAVLTALGVIGLVLGLIRRVVLLAVIFVVLAVAGVITLAVAADGTHCTPTSTEHVCVSIHR